MTRPAQITASHLSRKGVPYLRQSSLEQVREHTGSTALQRDLPSLLEAWGWLPEQIEMIDDDLGVSGAIADHRRGFNDLLRRMETGTVGIVAVTDISRLSRNVLDLARFAEVARRHDVLLAQGSHVVNFLDPNSEFVALILGLNAVRDNRFRTQQGREQRRKKAEAGLAPTAPPIGFVRTPAGTWDKHPDPHVRDAIQLVLDKFLVHGTVGREVRWLRHHDVLVPHRRRGGQVHWAAPTMSYVYEMLRNPAYCGIYVYGQTAIDESRERTAHGRPRRRLQAVDQWVVAENHHPGYIAPTQYAEIIAKLTSNQHTRIAPAGRGSALLQGLLRCALHSKPFKTQYQCRQRTGPNAAIRVATYMCLPYLKDADTTLCASIRAAILDPLIEAKVLAVLTPPSLDVLRQTVREALREHGAMVRAREQECLRAEQAVDEAERALDQVSPSRTHLWQRLAERLDEALGRRDTLRHQHFRHPLVPPLTLEVDELAELQGLLTDVPRLFTDPHVTPEDRKAIVRTVTQAVSVTPTPDRWHVEIEWAGGTRTALEITRPGRVGDVVRELYGAGLTDAQIAEEVTARGFIRYLGPHGGEPYRRKTIRDIIARLRVQQSFDTQARRLTRDRASMGVSNQAIADELNAKAIRPRLGRWTAQRVRRVLTRIQHGRISGIEPLPARPTLRERVLALFGQCASVAKLTAALQAEGVLTRDGTRVTYSTVLATVHRLKLASATHARNDRVATLLREWAPKTPATTMAERLTALGLPTMRGRPWTGETVKQKLRQLGLRAGRARPSFAERRSPDAQSQVPPGPIS